jgi:hypothetical protein
LKKDLKIFKKIEPTKTKKPKEKNDKPESMTAEN